MRRRPLGDKCLHILSLIIFVKNTIRRLYVAPQCLSLKRPAASLSIHPLRCHVLETMKTRTIILTALIVRVCIALGTQTFFQPDEYFQSLEVAHHFVFGYGHLTWEWLSYSPIRSILYPALNVTVYYALKWAQLDGTRLLVGEYRLRSGWMCVLTRSLKIWGPKVLHGVFASLTDIFLCVLTRKVLGERYVSVAVRVRVCIG